LAVIVRVLVGSVLVLGAAAAAVWAADSSKGTNRSDVGVPMYDHALLGQAVGFSVYLGLSALSVLALPRIHPAVSELGKPTVILSVCALPIFLYALAWVC